MQKGVDYTGVTVVYLCHDGKGNILLNKRSKNCRDEHGRWDPGGGGVEFGETVEGTIRKELKEEYNATALKIDFLNYADVHRVHEGKKTHWIALVFKVLVDRENVKNNEPHKFDEIGWFTIDNLPTPLHSQFSKYLNEFTQSF